MGGRGSTSGELNRSDSTAQESAVTPDSFSSAGNDSHIDWGNGSRALLISRMTGTRLGAANTMATAISAYTSDEYGAITRAQRNGDEESRAGKMGASLRKFQDAAIGAGLSWNGGPTYRGMYLSDDAYDSFMSNLGSGSLGLLEGYSASWTSDPKVAAAYSGAGKSMLDGHSNAVVFVHDNPSHKAVSIMGISNAPLHQRKWEKEVLSHPDNHYRYKRHVIGRNTNGDTVTYVYVDSE